MINFSELGPRPHTADTLVNPDIETAYRLQYNARLRSEIMTALVPLFTQSHDLDERKRDLLKNIIEGQDGAIDVDAHIVNALFDAKFLLATNRTDRQIDASGWHDIAVTTANNNKTRVIEYIVRLPEEEILPPASTQLTLAARNQGNIYDFRVWRLSRVTQQGRSPNIPK
jgi:hypothetical protein